MQKIGLLSDTHGYLDPQLEKFFSPCDEIWHAGDVGRVELIDELKNWKPVRGVYGNIDDHKVRSEFPEYLRFSVDGVDVFMIHIGGRPGRYSKGVIEKIGSIKPKLFICGHSHILQVKNDKKNGLLFMNPGAAGKHGFHKERTALRFDVDQRSVKNLELIKLGSR